MKKYLLKSFALLAMLFSAITLSAQSGVDWSTISWIGSTDATYNEKFKCSTTEGLVDIQKPFGDEYGIYMTFPKDVDLTCNLSGFYRQGAGLLLYLSSFTAQETQVVATWEGGSRTFWVYYADGTTGGSSEPETPDKEAPTLENVELFGAAQNFVLLTPTASDNKKVTAYLITPNGGAETEATLDDAGKIKISGLTMNTSYTYSVKAKDAAGNVSAAKEITFSTLDNVFCEEEVLPTNFFTKNQKLTLTAKKITTTKTLIELTSTTSTLTGVQNYNITNSGGGVISAQTDWTVANNTLSKTITWATYPTNPITMFVTALRTPGAGESNMIEFNYTIDVSNTCGGVIEENPTITTTPGYSAGAGADYTYLYTNDNAGNVYLWVTFNEALVGVAGPQFYTDGNVAIEAITTDNKVFYTSVSGKKDDDVVKLRARIPRANGLTETPLLSHTVGTESGLIVTEYCNYTNNQLTKNGASITLSWETVDNGDVVITMGNGVGTTSCSYRNGGFEGGIEAFVVSTDNFATTTPASDYFTFEKVYSGNEARLVNIANLPKGAKIKHIGAGHALAWVVNGTNEYDFPDFIYTYGGVCNNLDAPTNVAVTDAGILTFDEVVGANAYEVHVYQGTTLKHTQNIVNGGTINFEVYVAGTYIVKVIAKGEGKGDSSESDPAPWNMQASPLPGSNYCETPADRITENQGPCNPLFTWITDASGNVVITVSASEGNEGETMFRNNGMNGAFSLDGSVDNFNAYFNRGKTDDYTYTLTLKDAANKPALGSVISFSGQIEAKSSINVNDWSNYEFDGYLYGTKCDGPKRVTVSVNDAAMGTAKVNGQDEVYVDPDAEATFTATPNDGYVFVNWTKGDEVVSTSATYTTTITSALTLRANFDYERIAYCHYEVLATGGDAAGKKLYLTLGSNGTGKYYIKFEGSVEAPLASLNNANYTVNGVSTDILIDGVTSSGQDVPFTKANGRWSFDAAGYGSAMMEFSLADGKTISDIFVWTNFIAFGVVGGGELIYEDNQDRNKLFGNPAPLRYNIDWDNICVDDEAPVLVAPQAKALNATDVQLTLKATDNWDGLITYNISYHPTSDASSPVIVSTTGASAEEITYDILALTTGVEYTFTITASDGTNTSAAQTCVVTPAGDTEKPVMGTATLVSNTYKSAIIAVSATDNDEVGSYHVVCTNTAYEQTLTPTEGKITLTGLTAATAYNFTITAIDLAGNESENAATVECTTNIYNAKPTSAPTPPTHAAKQVKSVFSDVYGGTFSAMEGWGQATQFEELNFDGDHVRYYTNLNYLGWQTATPINASVMEKLHLDIWAAEDATIIIVPIYGGPGLTTDDKKTKTVTLEGQEWNSIDLTLATDFAGLNLSSIYQFKFDAPQGTDKFAIDNVYFYTTQVSSDVTPPTNITATAVPSFTTAVINCQATDESGSISYEVYFGEELKGTGSADSEKTASITVTNLQPNREFTMTVIATDVYGNKSPETVDVTFTTLAYPDPAPTPIWKAENVFSIYSDAYVPQATRAFGWGWGASTVEAEVELATGDKALQYTTSNYAGWELNGNTTIGDLTAYPYLHMDIYVENAGTIEFTPIWGAEALKTYTLKAGWNSIDIDLTAEFAGINLANIYQLKWAAMPATCFIDNVYFYKELHQEVTEPLEITEDYAYTSLTITEDGKVTISNGAKLIVKDFVIQSTMGAGKSGQLLGATSDNFDVIGDAYIDITLGKDAAADQWHAFTVPFPVNALNGIYKTDGTKLSNEVDYAIMDYHGDIRANGKYGWKKYHGDLVPGTFYIMTVNGDIKTFRFKKTDGSSVVAANNKALIAHNGSGTDTDWGWNGVGNPTLAYGSVAQAVQVLNPETYTYETHEANATNFTVGTPFFIQAASNGNMTMAVADASKPSYAPARQQTTEVKAKVYLSNDNYTDRLYITATDDATATYEIGKDLVKMTMTNTPNVPQLFARAYNTDLCMIHTPLSNDEAVVALNLYAPAAGEYTLSAEAQNGETIYLLKDNAIVWDLTASEYTIYLSQGNTEVYGVAIKRAPQVETGVNDGATIQTLPSKVILQGNLYILHNGQVYDAMGKCVK